MLVLIELDVKFKLCNGKLRGILNITVDISEWFLMLELPGERKAIERFCSLLRGLD